MRLPFTTEEFFHTFAQYNSAIWPAQVVLLVMALAVVYLAVRRSLALPALAPLLLAALWIWSGAVYHIAFFRRINALAVVFGAAFLLQAILLIVATRHHGLTFRFDRSARAWSGAGLILYAMVLYPLLGAWLGHRYPAAPTFGAPCPLAIFTLGILLWASLRVWYVLAIPLLWSAVGMSAAISLGVVEDYGLGIAAVVTVAWQFTRRLSAVRSVA
jgi:hypothetical protein